MCQRQNEEPVDTGLRGRRQKVIGMKGKKDLSYLSSYFFQDSFIYVRP